jgi:hypothetical protein
LRRVIPAIQFSRSKRLILFQIALLGYVEETQVFLKGKPSMFEAGAPSTLFSCEKCISLGKEYYLQPWSFKLVIASVSSK